MVKMKSTNGTTLFEKLFSLTKKATRKSQKKTELSEQSVQNWKPKPNSMETKNAHLFIVSLPDVKKESIVVELKSEKIWIKGIRHQEKHSSKGLHAEKDICFELVLSLPENTDKSKIEATFNNELLTLRVAKAEPSKPAGHSIEIRKSNH